MVDTQVSRDQLAIVHCARVLDGEKHDFCEFRVGRGVT